MSDDGRHALAPLVEVLPHGIFQAALPTHFPVGPVNCWLLAEEPVTVVDPGLCFPDSLAGLEGLLASVDLTPADVEQVVVTHGHPDHFGAAAWIAERSGAPILCGDAEQPKLLAGAFTHAGPAYRSMLDEMGVPIEDFSLMPFLMMQVQELVQTPDPEMIRTLSQADVIRAGGRSWEVHITPGHAPGHVSLHCGNDSLLLSGDHLLPEITPNPVIELDEQDAFRRRHSLVEYLESLDRFVALDPAVVMPGHGGAFTGVPQLVASVRDHHSDRADKIHSLIEGMGEPTVYDLSRALFPQLEGFGMILAVSEVIGHLDLLHDEGRVQESTEIPHRWRAA